jgi:hypothetical protein
MVWDIFISLGLLAAASAMAWMGVRVSLYPPRLKAEKNRHMVWFLVLGVIAAVLTIAQGIRNGISQKELLDQIAKNKPTITVQPAPVTVNNLPAAPALTPTHSNEQPQITFTQQPLKPGPAGYPAGQSDKPGVLAIVTMTNTFVNPAFQAKCSVPCSFLSAMAIDSSTGAEPLPQPSEDIIRVRFTIPGRLAAGKQVTLDIRSKDDKPVSLIWVRPYLP